MPMVLMSNSCISMPRLNAVSPHSSSVLASRRGISLYPQTRCVSRVTARAAKKSNDEKAKEFAFRDDHAGECDLADARDALEACRGLEGQDLEDCWASFNCNVDRVTEHYAKVAGVDVPKKKSPNEKSDKMSD